jgi:hypothetical protein
VKVRRVATLRRRLSSRTTLSYKCILPVYWTGLFALGTAGAFGGFFRDRAGNPCPLGVCFALLVITVVGAAFLFRMGLPLKAVWLEDDDLWVSNYLRTERIPLREVTDIQQWKWPSPLSVTVRFAREIGFGRSIHFVPLLSWWGPSPAIADLREAVAKARHQEKLAGSG